MIGQIIREEMDKLKKPDADLLVKKVVNKLIKDNDLLKESLSKMVRYECLRMMGLVRKNSRGGSSRRWDKAKDTFSHPIFRLWEYVNGEYKFLGDCSVDDIRSISEAKIEDALQYQRIADRYDDLAKLMKDKGVKKVKQLDGEEVAETLRVEDDEQV